MLVASTGYSLMNHLKPKKMAPTSVTNWLTNAPEIRHRSEFMTGGTVFDLHFDNSRSSTYQQKDNIWKLKDEVA